MKKSRVFVAAGVALLATGVLVACGNSKSSDSTAPKPMVMSIRLIQKHWTILSLEKRVRKWLLQTGSMASLQMINTGI